LEFKPLERKRGFLIYVTRTLPSMFFYLKGIHQTLDTWRPNRREDGWKLAPNKEILSRMRSEGERSKEPREMELPPERFAGSHGADHKLDPSETFGQKQDCASSLLRLW
jgi:hypothetical protein